MSTYHDVCEEMGARGAYLTDPAGHIDLAFEHGLVSFSDAGEMIFSPDFSLADRNAIGIPSSAKLSDLPQPTRAYLQWHRRFHEFE